MIDCGNKQIKKRDYLESPFKDNHNSSVLAANINLQRI